MSSSSIDSKHDTTSDTDTKEEEDDLAATLESKLKVTVADETTEKDEEHLVSDAPEALKQVAEMIKNVENILVLTGAGVSVAAGIPDFRTPGTGLYDNLQKYDLPYPEAVFDIQFYRENPQPFVLLASELWPNFLSQTAPKPTLTHTFVALLSDKGRLLRNYSQNIDGLEHMAEIPEEKLVECHGHFRSASCIQCGKAADIHSVKESITVHQKPPVCQHCTSSTHSKSKASRQPAYVKPDIVFFGENLPNRFFKSLQSDLEVADLCLILGTSLRVPPTAWIPDEVSSSCKRVLLNRELVGNLKVGSERDAFHAGDCDDSILWIARLLGWEDELLEKHESTRIKAKIAAKKIAKNKNVET